MSKQQSGGGGGKGNPASHRMSNKKREDRRTASHVRGQRRRQQRREENEARARANVARRAAGEPTPWELAKAQRRKAREHLQRSRTVTARTAGS